MSGTQKKKPSANEPVHQPPQRPFTLGLVVLVAGGVSTWHWYKPLPPDAGNEQQAHWNHSVEEDLWGDTELIRPSLDSLDLYTEGGSTHPIDGLVGTNANQLIPVPTYRKNLGEILSTEAQPTLPEVPEIDFASSQGAKVWTNQLEDSPPPSLYASSPSSPHLPTSHWPDQTYDPRRGSDVSSPPQLSNAPSLLPATNATQSRVIRTQEGEPYGISEHRYPSPPSELPAEAPRTPQFIRQPRR